MMAVQTFTFDAQAPIRTILKDDEPWFVAADVCAALTISNPSDAIKGLDDDERTTLDNPEGRAGEGAQSFNLISESGLYTLILRSRKPQARAFRRWVTHEVLPALRRTGRYEVPPPTVGSVSGASVLRYDSHPVRVFRHLGQAWVVAKDFCLACGYSWHKGGALVVGVPENLKGIATIETLEGDTRQPHLVLSLAGIQHFSQRARYVEARAFHAWMKEVISTQDLPTNPVVPTQKRTQHLHSRSSDRAIASSEPSATAPAFVPPPGERAHFAEEALHYHQRRSDMRDLRYAYEAHMPQLLADLMHLAEERGIDFGDMLTLGRQHFICERAAR